MSAVAGRLGVHVSQQTFRVLLDTLAQPGTSAMLPAPPTGVPSALLPALALSDVEVAVRVLAVDLTDWESVIATATGAPRAATMATAELVTALRPVTRDEVLLLGRGTALRPEDGTRLVLGVERLTPLDLEETPQPGSIVLRLTGPGVPGVRRLAVVGITEEVAEAVAATRVGYPAGVDVHLVDGSGRTVSIPRSTGVQIEQLVGSDR